MTRQPPTQQRTSGPFRSIGEFFRRTRVRDGSEQSLRRFAEVMDLDHVHLSLIEKGQRFPKEAVVRRLARESGEAPQDLVGVLWRDRIVAAIRRELTKALVDGEPVDSRSAGEETAAESGPTWAPVVARVLSAMPDSGEPLPMPRYRTVVRDALRAERGRASRADVATLLERLQVQGLVECTDAGARKAERHFQAEEADDRFDLAIELAAVFAKGLTDKLFRGRTDSYLRNHFARIAPERIPDFQARIHAAIRDIAEEFDAGEEGDGEQVRVLVSQVGDR